MENLIKVTEYYEIEAKEEINAECFNKFMEKITVWDYAFVTNKHYLSLRNYEKEGR